MSFADVVLIESALVHQERVFTYQIPEGLDVHVGSLVRVPFRRRRLQAVVVDLRESTDLESALDIAAVLGPGLRDEDVSLGRWISERTLATLGESLAAVVPQRVAGEENAAPRPRHDVRRPFSCAWLDAYSGGRALQRALTSGDGAYLWRPRADEIRGRAIASMVDAALRRDKGALVLLPEVRVAGEVVTALSEAFGNELALLAGDRPARERYRDWLALREGTKRIGVGGRATVLAPMRGLGLIVVDDEGHVSYKERRAPRYHARAVAAERARRANATLVLIGAPPSIEAFEAVRRGNLVGVIPSRAREMRMRPAVTVIDRTRTQEQHVPTAQLLGMARATLESGRRVVLLIHRKGEAARRIGRRATAALRAQAPVQLEAGAAPRDLLAAAGKADLIVATPVIAKDVALEGIGLVGIVETDAALSVPEFRAAEETFATWWHVGRWASGDKPGAMAIETSSPREPAIAALARWDPDVLFRAEAARRSELRYPPYASLARVNIDAERAEQTASELASLEGVEVLGPAGEGTKAVFVVRGQTRNELLRSLRPLASQWRETGAPVVIDVDPREVLA